MNNKTWDALWINAHIATMQNGLMQHGALAVKEGKIDWIGVMTPDILQNAKKIIDVQGALMTPGLIDCHTHLVYAGNRAHEFNLRLQGVSYAEIAKAGGGILSTVRATRAASEAQLFEASQARLSALIAEGVTTIEIKSGYGLDFITERKMLRVAKRLAEHFPITIKKTFLGAHTVPPEYVGRAAEYIHDVCEVMLPQLMDENLVDAIDVFCEKIGFDLALTQKIFETAQKYHLPIKCHAEQLSSMGASQLAAQFNALSVDHCEFMTEEAVQVIAKSGTVVVLLPGAFYYLRETQLPPIELLRRYEVPIAIATDCNPGTSPVTSLLLMLNMACILFHLTPEEALKGVTIHAAKALGVEKTQGSLQAGKVADFLVWNVSHPDELCYSIGSSKVVQRVKNGVSAAIS